MNIGLPPVEFLMYTKVASGIGIAYLYVPFMVTAIYLSLVNFNFDILEVAKVNGAKPWRALPAATEVRDETASTGLRGCCSDAGSVRRRHRRRW